MILKNIFQISLCARARQFQTLTARMAVDIGGMRKPYRSGADTFDVKDLVRHWNNAFRIQLLAVN